MEGIGKSASSPGPASPRGTQVADLSRICASLLPKKQTALSLQIVQKRIVLAG
jgi:hypothetical protein